MRFGGMTLEELHDNILKFNTVCTLNAGKTTCLPPSFINVIYQKQLNNKKNETDINNKILDNLKHNKNLIITKINEVSEDCGCDKEKTINDKELCIVKNLDNYIINKEEKDCILYEYFKPEGSHDGDSWLNNTHVDVIQEHLYKKFPGYYYGFIHMIDNIMIKPQNLKCIKHPVKCITDINFVKEVKDNEKDEFTDNGKMKWHGIVYNTDPSHKSGQHWFCILFNFSTSGTEMDPYLVEYFNSSGSDIENKDFKIFLEQIIASISYHSGKKIIFKKVTNIQHQKDTTGNCGIYSLYYIWSRLSGVPLETFNNPDKKITDEMMENFRKVMFRKEE